MFLSSLWWSSPQSIISSGFSFTFEQQRTPVSFIPRDIADLPSPFFFRSTFSTTALILNHHFLPYQHKMALDVFRPHVPSPLHCGPGFWGEGPCLESVLTETALSLLMKLLGLISVSPVRVTLPHAGERRQLQSFPPLGESSAGAEFILPSQGFLSSLLLCWRGSFSLVPWASWPSLGPGRDPSLVSCLAGPWAGRGRRRGWAGSSSILRTFSLSNQVQKPMKART